MKALTVSIVAAAMALGPAAFAKDQPGKQNSSHLKDALAAVVAVADPQGPKPPDHFKPKNNDNSQGAENANPRAILNVCSKDTPAAHRAAICRTGVSPD